MMIEGKGNRRQFLLTAPLLGGIPLLMSGVTTPDTNGLALQSLVRCLREQDRVSGQKLEPAQIRNMTLAFERIQPTRHGEFAMVVMCGICVRRVDHVIDEYVRRRAGQSPEFFDHPLFALKDRARPDTQRLMVFREQYECFFAEVTRTPYAVMYRKLATRRPSFRHDFLVSVTDDIRARYSERELIEIADGLDAHYQSFPQNSYVFCSTIADRALAGSANPFS